MKAGTRGMRKALGTGLVVATLLAGCQSAGRKRPYPPDPLLLNKAPVEARPALASAPPPRQRPEAPALLALAGQRGSSDTAALARE